MRRPTIRAGTLTATDAAKLRNDMNAIGRERDEVKAKLQARDQLLTEKQAEITALKRDNQTIGAQLSGKESTIASLNAEIADLKRGNEATGELAREKAALTTEVATLRSEIASRDGIISRHLAEIDRLKDAPPITAPDIPHTEVQPVTMPVASAMTNIGAQVADANRTLKSDHNFAISNVNVVLKGKTDDAGQIKLFDPLAGAKAAGLDEINFGIQPGPGTDEPSGEQARVPNLRGLTVGAATRMLSTVGLRIDPASGKAPNNAGLAMGQAYRQSPAADAVVDRGASVLVIFNQ